jgi:hypothetical protein
MAKAKTAFSQAGRIALQWCLSLLATKSGQLFARTESLVQLIALGHSTIQTTVTLSDKYPASSPVVRRFRDSQRQASSRPHEQSSRLVRRGWRRHIHSRPFPDEGEALLAG